MYRPHQLNREERDALRQKLNAMDADEMDAAKVDVTAETMPAAIMEGLEPFLEELERF